MCQDVVSRARSAGAVVIVNDRADIARLSAADGVHVGQEDLDPVGEANSWAGGGGRHLDAFARTGRRGVDASG